LNLKGLEKDFEMDLKKRKKTTKPHNPLSPSPFQPSRPTFSFFLSHSRAGRRPSLSLTCALAAHRTTQATELNRRPSISLFPFYFFSFSR
jgi:hypothetical protein